MGDLSRRDFHVFCHSVIFLMYTDTNFHFSWVIMSQGNGMYRLKLQASICPYVWTALAARSLQGDQGGFRGMISTALFEEAEMSERSDRAFSKHWGWLWVLCDAAVEEEGGYRLAAVKMHRWWKEQGAKIPVVIWDCLCCVASKITSLSSKTRSCLSCFS